MVARSLTPVLARHGIAAIALLASTGCNRYRDPPGAAIIRMVDHAFSPPVTHIPVGGHVMFRNMGMSQHNAIATDSIWSTWKKSGRLDMLSGQWTELVFDRPGVFPFFCSFHGTTDGKSGMVGVVVVGEVAYNPGATPESKLAVVEQPTGVTRRVPEDYPNVQNAVDAAQPGDLILIAPGVYREEVQVTTPSLTIRGSDRNQVVLDGEFQRGNAFAVFADAVVIENLTARHYLLNGFFWNGVTGYRASYVTANNDGDYGLYSYDSYNGVWDHSYASGSPDAAFYIGGCYPCKAVIDGVIGEHSNLGYSGTNSGGDLYIVNSIFRNNFGSGIVPNTYDIEPKPPQRETTIIGNLVLDNGGAGIVMAGASKNWVERNYISGHRSHGILIRAQYDKNFWPSTGNVFRDNVILKSGRADIAISGWGNLGNCFEGNFHQTTVPWGLTVLQRCAGARMPVVGDFNSYFGHLRGINRFFVPVQRTERDNWWRKQPYPPPQDQMPGGAGAPVRPAVKPFEAYRVDLKAIRLPTPSTSVVALRDKGGA